MIVFRTLAFIFCTQVVFICAQTSVCPGGTFSMGSEHGDSDEKPVHAVTISSFSISKKEVTEAQYDSCVKAGKCTPAHYDDGSCEAWDGKQFNHVKVPAAFRQSSYPVVCVNWYQAKAYCKSKGMELPSEAQWEYAAGAQTQGKYSWGNDPPSDKNCTMKGSGHPGQTGKYSPNKWGLYDMTGNVWEWTSDLYELTYYAQSVQKDPSGPDAGLFRVIRGGGWYSSADQLSITNRHWFSPDYAEVSLGFRCVKKTE